MFPDRLPTLTSFFQLRGDGPSSAASTFAILSSLRRQATSTVIHALRLQPVYRTRFIGHKFELSGLLHAGLLPSEPRLARAA